jgi:hypothetical protein
MFACTDVPTIAVEYCDQGSESWTQKLRNHGALSLVLVVAHYGLANKL